MIEQLTIENFLSFKERITFEFCASMEKPKLGYENIPWYQFNNKRKILKLQFLFGNNGTGKSNFLNAIYSICQLACRKSNSKTDDISRIPDFYFKFAEDSLHKPTYFKIIFHVNGKRYSYEISCFNNTIVTENLTRCDVGRKEMEIFRRSFNQADDIVEIKYPNKYISKEAQSIINDSVISNTSVISIYDEKNILSEDLRDTYNYFYHIQWFPLLENIDLPSMFINRKDDKELKKILIGLLNDLGSNIIDYKIETIEPKLSDQEILIFKTLFGEEEFKQKFAGGKRKIATLQFAHPADDVLKIGWLNETEESEGTLNMIRLIIVLYDAIKLNVPVLIDECASGIHQQTFGRIIQFFLYCSENAQAFLASQHLSIMEMEGFRRDTMKFFDKNRETGETTCKKVDLRRYHKNISILKAYLDNSFGSLPQFPTKEEWDLHLYKFKEEMAPVTK